MEGKGSSPISTPFTTLLQSELPKNHTWSAPPLLKTFKAPLDFWILGTWPQPDISGLAFLQLGLHTLVVPGLTVLLLISFSWQKESLHLELPWLLCLFWLIPIYPLCLSSGMASPGLPPQIPPAPLYLGSVSRTGKLPLNIPIVFEATRFYHRSMRVYTNGQSTFQ